MFDIVAHGDPHGIEVSSGGTVLPADSRAAARLIQNAPGYTDGQPVRLLSCSTGATASGSAQNLANELGVPVTAPTDLLWAYDNGSFVVAPRTSTNPNSFYYNVPDLSRQGTFRTFTPGKPK